MKIGQPVEKPIVPPTVTPNTPPPKAESGAAAAASSASTTAKRSAESAGVSVTVSTQARALDQANRGESAEFNMAKVEEVRTAIEQGTYVVNPEAIADKLLANAKEMLSRTQN